MNDTNYAVELIYEAAFVPENWIRVLDEMAKVANSHGTALFNTNATASRAIATPSLDDLSHKMLNEGWITRNTRAEKLLRIEHPGFIDEARYFTDEECDAQPIFTQVLRPLGYGFGTSTHVKAPSGDSIVFAVEKKKATGPVSAAAIAHLDTLRPHLARAAMISSRLEFERINAAVEALQISGLPSAVLRADGSLLGTNALIENMAPQIVMAAHNRIRFAHAPANAMLEEVLAPSSSGQVKGKSFPVPRSYGLPPAVVHVVPVEGSAHDIFTNAAAFLIVTPIDRDRVPSAEAIQGMFDLTPSEAKVAQILAAGNDVNAAAIQLSISAETVRSHVKAILSKSGMLRQVDLVAAIASIRSV